MDKKDTKNVKLDEAIDADDGSTFRELFIPQDLIESPSELGLLLEAVFAESPSIVEFLIENGADVNRRSTLFDGPPVTHSATNGNVSITRMLIDAGSDLPVENPIVNPLLCAVEKGHLAIVECLLQAGIDAHATYRMRTGDLKNALTEAEQYRRHDIVQLLKSHGCRRPVEGEDIPLWEPAPEMMVDQTPEYKQYKEIIQYMEARFGEADRNGMQEALSIMKGMSVAINIIPPSDKHPYLVLFTNGMSDLPMSVPAGQERWRYAELAMHLPADWVHPRDAGTDEKWMWPLKWLRQMAYYPHINETWLGLPAAIVSSAEPPQPLGPDVAQTCLMMLPDLSNLQDPLTRADGKEVHFFTLVPLYTEERDYELQHGMEAFLDRLIEHEVPMTFDPDRPNFASDNK